MQVAEEHEFPEAPGAFSPQPGEFRRAQRAREQEPRAALVSGTGTRAGARAGEHFPFRCHTFDAYDQSEDFRQHTPDSDQEGPDIIQRFLDMLLETSPGSKTLGFLEACGSGTSLDCQSAEDSGTHELPNVGLTTPRVNGSDQDGELD